MADDPYLDSTHIEDRPETDLARLWARLAELEAAITRYAQGQREIADAIQAAAERDVERMNDVARDFAVHAARAHAAWEAAAGKFLDELRRSRPQTDDPT